MLKKTCVDMFSIKLDCFFEKNSLKLQSVVPCTKHVFRQTKNIITCLIFIFCFGSKIIAFQVEIAMFSTYIF